MQVAYSNLHLAPKGNVPGTVQIGIEAMMALLAFKQALALAVCLLNVAALGATPAGIFRVNLASALYCVMNSSQLGSLPKRVTSRKSRSTIAVALVAGVQVV
jgi:hypothetical protein